MEGVGLISSPQKGEWVKQDGELHQAPPAPPCFLKKNFLPPLNSIFPCLDIREVQREKMVAYVQALQYWAEKTDLPTGGKPCLLVESVKELQEEMKCYLSFSDKEVFKDVTLLDPICQKVWGRGFIIGRLWLPLQKLPPLHKN